MGSESEGHKIQFLFCALTSLWISNERQLYLQAIFTRIMATYMYIILVYYNPIIWFMNHEYMYTVLQQEIDITEWEP